MISSSHGVPWSNKSKMSRSSVSSPEANILSFSHRCGSGVKGANPRVRDSTIRIDRGIRLNKLRMGDISVEKGGFISPNYLYKTIVSLKEQIMKTKTYPKSAFSVCATSSAARTTHHLDGQFLAELAIYYKSRVVA